MAQIDNINAFMRLSYPSRYAHRSKNDELHAVGLAHSWVSLSHMDFINPP